MTDEEKREKDRVAKRDPKYRKGKAEAARVRREKEDDVAKLRSMVYAMVRIPRDTVD